MPKKTKKPLKKKRKKSQGDMIFALDIGTRSVIGVVGVADGEMFKVLAVESMEHDKRAMVDGQIEDVEQVAKVAGIVKKKLEDKLGVKLAHVCVAAAGRCLKTQKATCETKLQGKQLINQSQVAQFELAAVKVAYDKLVSEEEEVISYSCVGYSVLKYYLDDYAISTLVDHRGKSVKVEIVATFLPNEVIESLYEVMTRIGLVVSSLTLEPIAAMNAIIPKELRMLNLALVDIGAGTSDIAISSGGSVVAYTMVTIAGDEISDAIVQNYLVDFETAETIKQQLSQGVEYITFQDIMGLDYELSSSKILETVKDCSKKLCEEIANAILSINEQKPAAVFLVGGGSRLVNLGEMMANELDIPIQKVAVGGSNYMKKMIESEIDVTAAEYATPMGIAITAMNMKEKSNIGITVNKKPVNIFKSSAITAMDVLLMSEYKQSQIIGKSGKNVVFELNTKKVISYGKPAVPAQININGKPASLTSVMNVGDDLQIKPAVSGKNAHPRLSEYVSNLKQFDVTLNGESKTVGTNITINGKLQQDDINIYNFDVIETNEISTLKQLCEKENINYDSYSFTVNGQEKGIDYCLAENDEITYKDKGEEKEIPTVETEPVKQSEGQLKKIYVTINDNNMELICKQDNTPYLFFDMLNYVDIDTSKPQGNIVLKLNDKEAQYMDEVKDGDDVKIYWDKLLEKTIN